MSANPEALTFPYEPPCFLRFLELPTELRLKVWEEYLPLLRRGNAPTILTFEVARSHEDPLCHKIFGVESLAPLIDATRTLSILHHETNDIIKSELPDTLYFTESQHIAEPCFLRYRKNEDIVYLHHFARSEDLDRVPVRIHHDFRGFADNVRTLMVNHRSFGTVHAEVLFALNHFSYIDEVQCTLTTTYHGEGRWKPSRYLVRLAGLRGWKLVALWRDKLDMPHKSKIEVNRTAMFSLFDSGTNSTLSRSNSSAAVSTISLADRAEPLELSDRGPDSDRGEEPGSVEDDSENTDSSLEDEGMGDFLQQMGDLLGPAVGSPSDAGMRQLDTQRRIVQGFVDIEVEVQRILSPGRNAAGGRVRQEDLML